MKNGEYKSAVTLADKNFVAFQKRLEDQPQKLAALHREFGVALTEVHRYEQAQSHLTTSTR